MASAITAFYRDNRSHLEPWSPPFSEGFLAIENHRLRLADADRAFDEGRAWRWILSERDTPETAAGFVHFSQIARGAFQSATLGYGLAKRAEGKGLMTEALTLAIDEVFGPSGRLHRIQANVVPANTRSYALLKRLGFRTEGMAPDYLFIGGRWQDHLLMAKTNPGFDLSWLP